MKNPAPHDAIEYILLQSEKFRNNLEQLRDIIFSEVPEAEEVISYGIPCFKHHYMLVGIGVTKTVCSFYTMNPELVKSMKDELADIKHSGSTLYFPPQKPLPEKLIRKIIQIRIKENEAKKKPKEM